MVERLEEADQLISQVFDGPAGKRLDLLVTELIVQVEKLSRSQVQRLIRSGAVEVDGISQCKPGVLVKPGQEISISLQGLHPGNTIEPERIPLEILFEDHELLVINKPAGLVMHPGAGVHRGTLVNAVVFHLGGVATEFSHSIRPGIVHRLDKGTSGLVVVAKSLKAHASLAEQFSERTVQRAYQALVFTTPRSKREVDQKESGMIDRPLGRDPRNPLRMAVVEGGKRAVTHWRVLERFGYGTLIECKLETGRTHQIRVHLESVGAPLIGDPLYGDCRGLPKKLFLESTAFARQALHAFRLGFSHPKTGENLLFEQEPPSDFQKLLNAFRAQNEGNG